MKKVRLGKQTKQPLLESAPDRSVWGICGALKFSMMNFATWQEVSFSFDPSPSILVLSVLAGAAMGLLGGFFPALRAARTSPVIAMRA